VWHFVPGLALSAVVTGVALWGGSIPASQAPGLAPDAGHFARHGRRQHRLPANLEILRRRRDFRQTASAASGIILYGFRLTFAQIADVGVSGIAIDVLTLTSTFYWPALSARKCLAWISKPAG
jgi:uncharacterized membrane protein YadS